MTPKIEALTDQLLSLSQDFSAKQRPGVPIDMDSPDVKQIRSLLEELQRDVEQFDKEQSAILRAHAEAVQKDAAEQLRQLTEPPPPSVPPDIGIPGAITFRFQDEESPAAEKMHGVVEELLKLAKE